MFNVRLAGGHLYGKQLFTWLSLVVSLMASFVLSFFPLDVLHEIWDLIESVSEGFLTYSFTLTEMLSERPFLFSGKIRTDQCDRVFEKVNSYYVSLADTEVFPFKNNPEI